MRTPFALNHIPHHCIQFTGVIALTLLTAPLLSVRFSPTSLASAEAPLPETVSEYTPEGNILQHNNIRRLLITNECASCDLSGVTLIEAHLIGADLGNANLQSANLTGANLEGADLEGADLTGANLSYAFLTNTYLENTQLFSVKFSGANN